jgi:pimeloyl-ACP methyl ester carboxylesterase
MLRRRLAFLLPLLLALALSACSQDGSPPGPVAVEIDGLRTEVVESDRLSGTYTCPDDAEVRLQAVVLSTTRGDDVLLVRPQTSWQGDLIVFAHGYRDPARPAGFWSDGLPADLDGVLAALGGLEGGGDLSGGVAQALALAACPVALEGAFGFDKPSAAFAASSYSATGYAVEGGVPETHLTNALFERFLGPPERTYLAGASLGGIVTLEVAERYPERYDGALPVCGPVGGSLLQLAYVGHVELLFRTLYPDVFDGGAVGDIDLAEPLGLPYGDPTAPGDPALEDTVVNRIVAAANADPSGLEQLARIEVDPLGGARRPLLQVDPDDPDSLLRSVLDAFFYTAVGKRDVLDLAGGLPFDNGATTYWLDDAPFAGVPRFAGDPEARSYFARHYEPTGELRLPTLTVHNRYDPVVPAFHEEAYADAVAGAGQDGLLRTAIVPFEGLPPTGTEPFGHCAFPAEVVAAFGLLQDWVETGVPPVLPAGLTRASELEVAPAPR